MTVLFYFPKKRYEKRNRQKNLASCINRFFYLKKLKAATPGPLNRSRIILVDRYEEKEKYWFSFHFEDGGETKLFNASYRFVTILKEGDPLLLFDKSKEVNSNNNEFEEPNIPWKKSLARKLLYKDVMEGKVPLEGTAKTTDFSSVYMMHPEYAVWYFGSLPRRLDWIQKIIKKCQLRVAND